MKRRDYILLLISILVWIFCMVFCRIWSLREKEEFKAPTESVSERQPIMKFTIRPESWKLTENPYE